MGTVLREDAISADVFQIMLLENTSSEECTE